MANNLRKFNTYSDYEAAELVKPAVSLIAATDEVYFDQKEAPVPPTPSDFCRLTLNNGETVDIEGSGELTQNVISGYSATCVSAEIGTACTSIGESAFIYCNGLTDVVLGDQIASIGSNAFAGCSSLTRITSNAMTAPTIGYYTFNSVGENGTLTVPSGSIGYCAWMDNTYFSQHGWTTEGVTCGGGSGLTVYYNITESGSGSGSGELTPTVLFRGGGSGSGSGSGSGGALPSAMIIDGTAVEVTNTYQFSTAGEHIVNYSFADNQIPEEFLYGGSEHIFNNVVKITIGDAITSIGREAFLECYGLTSATISSDITIIGSAAFASCTGLTSINIPSGVTSIGESVFYMCGKLKSIVIPNSVTSIGDYAFDGCSSLTSITSNAMTAPSLGYNAFSSINYNGVLTVPSDSQGYCDWMYGYLPNYWTIEGVTCE